VSTWSAADAAWQADREAVALGYEAEMREYATERPRPTFKRVLIGLAGSRHDELVVA
jgi:hypothetical protein